VTPYYERDGIVIYHGDCLEVLPQIEAVDHVITDPPYFKDVYLRAAAPASKLGSGTPGRLGVSLHKLAAGDIGVLTEGMAGRTAVGLST
jgi:site-specific DNA-methyltransferase (adenine-specific)